VALAPYALDPKSLPKLKKGYDIWAKDQEAKRAAREVEKAQAKAEAPADEEPKADGLPKVEQARPSTAAPARPPPRRTASPPSPEPHPAIAPAPCGGLGLSARRASTDRAHDARENDRRDSSGARSTARPMVTPATTRASAYALPIHRHAQMPLAQTKSEPTRAPPHLREQAGGRHTRRRLVCEARIAPRTGDDGSPTT
jgi:hypothetical protein